MALFALGVNDSLFYKKNIILPLSYEEKPTSFLIPFTLLEP